MSRPKLLLTGATGFVGRQILSQLDATHEIHCTSRDEHPSDHAIWHSLDLRDPEACRRLMANIRSDILIHAAWNTEHGVFWEAEDNAEWLEGGRAMFSAFAEFGGSRVIGCGSCAEYGGESSEPRRESEERNANPETRYGRAKLALYKHLMALPVASAWARIFLVYGPGEDQRRLVPSIARALLRGEAARCSSGRQIRDFIDVRDLGRALATLASSKVVGPVNLGQGQERSIADVARLLGQLAGRPDLIRLGALPDRPGESCRLVPDLTRQRKELGFAPNIDLRQGLKDALETAATQLDIL